METEKNMAPNPMLHRQFVVRRFGKETADTFTLQLEPQDGAPLAFGPGQFNMLYLFGAGEVPISISGDAAKPSVLIHTIRAVGSVTNLMQRLKKGDVVGVRGPYGAAWPVAAAEGSDVLIITGGIGLAPLRPALYHILRHRKRYGRVSLLYGARTPADILYRKELEKWRARMDIDVAVTVDHATGGWKGHVGLVTTLIRRASFDPPRSAAMICGPEVMMRFTAMDLIERGVGPASIAVSMERSMKCGIGLCGHCQCGRFFVCKDGPVFPYPAVERLLQTREI